ncbi:TPA: hypothetical protein ACXPT9_005453 [Bacillus cereus]
MDKEQFEKHQEGDINDKGQIWICRRFITTRNGKRVYPKNGKKAICFWANPK